MKCQASARLCWHFSDEGHKKAPQRSPEKDQQGLLTQFCFPLPGLLYSVWQSLGPSTSLHMTQFHSFSRLSNIPLSVCTTSSLSILLLMYMWNLEKWYKWCYFQSGNRDTDIEKKTMDTMGDSGGSGWTGRLGLIKHILLILSIK